jgi:hypothetical protein
VIQYNILCFGILFYMVSTDISVVLPVDELPWLEIVPVCFGKVESALNFSVRVWQEEASVELPWQELVPVCFGKVEPAFSFFVRVWQEYAPSSVNINSLCII